MPAARTDVFVKEHAYHIVLAAIGGRREFLELWVALALSWKAKLPPSSPTTPLNF